MTNAPILRPFRADEWMTYRDLRLRSLAESPDSFGRTLAEESMRADTAWAERVTMAASSAHDLALLAQVDGEPVGLAWGRIEPASPDTASLYQMWVDPSRRRLGIGQQLLDTVISWAVNAGARSLTLAVVAANGPAQRMYVNAGFVNDGPSEPLRPGSALLSQPMRLTLHKS